MSETRPCPYCAEQISVEALVCPQCRTGLGRSPVPDAYRDRPGRQVAGVAVALADAFGISVTFVRLVFIVTTFVSFVGPVIYGALWLLLPNRPGELSPLGKLVTDVTGERDGGPSILERMLDWLRVEYAKLIDWYRGRRSNAGGSDGAPPAAPNGPETPVEGAS